MERRLPFRQYVVLGANEEVSRLYWNGSLDELRLFLARRLSGDKELEFLHDKDKFDVLAAPTRNWAPRIIRSRDYGGGRKDDVEERRPDELLISCGFSDPELVRQFRDAVDRNKDEVFLEFGADPGGAAADHWCPAGPTQLTFGDRADAEEILEAEVLRDQGLDGAHVNVVIIDDGLSAAALPAHNWGGGLAHGGTMPGGAPPDSHGMAVARNILKLAPRAVLYDVPLIPPRIVDVPVFTSSAHGAYSWMLLLVNLLRQFPQWDGPWVFVNAWAIFDRASDVPLGDYTENAAPGGHPFNRIVGQTTLYHRVDVVFAAGNCGQFCPDRRCGKLDRGPGRSIWGANSHPGVLTVGAVRNDLLWLGYSAQGPGQPLLSEEKPDLCAPSQFHETDDAHMQNGGTSTACALAAGAIAALRSNPTWDAGTVTPASLKQVLNSTARKVKGPDWHRRLGNGVLNARAAYDELAAGSSEKLFAPIARSYPPRDRA